MDRPGLKKVIAYYDSALAQHGPTAKGMDWRDESSQELRFAQLVRLLPADGPFSVLDYGCGSGAFRKYLTTHRPLATYFGFDVSSAMLEAAARVFPSAPATTWLPSLPAKKKFDYCVASGVFNVKLDSDEAAWKQNVLDWLREINDLAEQGWAVNFLTLYSDRDRRQEKLYYADPEFYFGYCKKNFSRKVALLHDYELYEFTIGVKK